MRNASATMLGAAVLVAAIALGTAVRIRTPLALPNFDATRAEGMLKSDPALIYYVTQRIIESGGLPPEDFRADPRIEYPDTSDIPAMFAVGQEFVVAWAHLLCGAELPLHVLCVIVMAIVASLCAVGVYGLALELTGRVQWACLAALLYALIPANYRTIGFILVREDASLPLFSLHLWLLARAARVQTPASFALAAVSLALALATWHAMSFVVTLLALCIFAWFLRSGRNPLAAPRAWLFPAVLAAAALLIPVLRAKLFLLSIPMQIALALLVAAAFQRRRPSPAAARALVGLGSWGAAFVVSLALTRLIAPGSGDYGHVLDFVWAKVRTLGALPEDPAALSFGARLLWHGPFRTGSLGQLLRVLSAAGIALPIAAAVAVPAWVRGRGDDRVAVLMAFGAASLVGALLISRLGVFCGLLAPAAVVVLLREERRISAAAWMIGLVLLQGGLFAARITHYTLDQWYPPRATAELAATVEWIRDHLPDDGAIAADFVNSPAILAHTRHPVVLQPKYETRRSRERIEGFVTGLYWKSPEGFRRLLREEFDARYLLIHVPVLWESRYQAGLRYSASAPQPGSAAEALMAPRRGDFGAVPGFHLLYGSAGERPSFRLYQIEGE